MTSHGTLLRFARALAVVLAAALVSAACGTTLVPSRPATSVNPSAPRCLPIAANPRVPPADPAGRLGCVWVGVRSPVGGG